MADYIKRESLLGPNGLFAQRGCTGECEHCGLWSKDGCKVILEATAEDVAPIVHAEWIKIKSNGVGATAECSNCGRAIYGYYTMKYCPDCGAKMDGGKRDD